MAPNGAQWRPMAPNGWAALGGAGRRWAALGGAGRRWAALGVFFSHHSVARRTNSAANGALAHRGAAAV